MTTVVPPRPTTESPAREDQPPWRLCHVIHQNYNGNLCGSVGPAVLAEDTRCDRDGRCAFCHAQRCPRCVALLSEGVG